MIMNYYNIIEKQIKVYLKINNKLKLTLKNMEIVQVINFDKKT